MKERVLTFKEFLNTCAEPNPPPDPLAALGKNLLKIPQAYWQKRMLFSGALNTELFEKTGEFPARSKKPSLTHPVFVIKKIGSFAFKLCPCSSKLIRGCRYIRKGCRLEISETIMDRNSCLLEQYTFNLSKDPSFCGRLIFRGKVPRSCIVQGQK